MSLTRLQSAELRSNRIDFYGMTRSSPNGGRLLDSQLKLLIFGQNRPPGWCTDRTREGKANLLDCRARAPAVAVPAAIRLCAGGW